MAIDYEDIAPNFRRIMLSGRLDIPGTDAVATRFAALATGPGYRIVVDLTAVSFLASIGIRDLITNAKALQQRGGRMALFVGSNAMVTKTLDTSGVDALIPTFADRAAADKAALA